MFLKKFFMACIVCLLLPAGLLAADRPAERIDTYIDKVLQVFQEVEPCTGECPDDSQLREKLSRLGKELFDFRIMSMMTLGRHWKKLGQQQQDDFVDLFTQLLEVNYFEKIVTHFQKIKEYSKDKVEIVDETLFSSRKAEVESLIWHEDKKIPVDYRLVLRDESWRIYDVSVEGVSLIGNYRKQFDEILFDKSPEKMLDSLRRNLADKS